MTDWPGIYSAGDSVGSDQFDGFCFGFARPADVLHLTDGDESALARQEALRRFTALEDSESPILLFLERISGLTLEWLDWKEQAWVSVAVCPDEELKTGCMYTFLPMEHAASVFHGHLNAPFYTKLARRDVSEEIHLNTFLLDCVADLCVETVMRVALGNSITDCLP